MRVTDVRTFLVHPGTGKNWLFVRLETDTGLVGWGECYTQSDRDRSIVATIEQMSTTSRSPPHFFSRAIAPGLRAG